MKSRSGPSIRLTLVASALMAMATTADAQVVQQLTDLRNTRARQPVIDGAGANVYFASSSNALGTNPGNAFQLFQVGTSSGAATQLSSFAAGVWDALQGVSVSKDGAWIAFPSRGNLTGLNHDLSAELFVMRTDGTGLAQLTNDPGPAGGAVKAVAMAGSGGRIAFVSNSDPTGGNPAHHEQIFVVDRDGTDLVQATSFASGTILSLSVSDDGTRLAFVSNANPLSLNFDLGHEVFAVSWDGTGLRQVSAGTVGECSRVVLAGNGSRLAFESTGDYLGTNADLRPDIYAFDWDTAALRQITESPNGRESGNPAITDDGAVVYYNSNKSNFKWRIWRVNGDGTGTGQVSATTIDADVLAVSGGGARLVWQALGSVHSMTTAGTDLRTLFVDAHDVVDSPAISADGTRMAFISTANLTGTNPGGHRALYRRNVDGTELMALVSGQNTYDAQISADGSVIFYTKYPPNVLEEVFRIDWDGTGETRLTFSNPGDFTFSSQPAISADGSTVVFTSSENPEGGPNGDNSGEIFRMNLDGTGIVQLTNTSDQVFYRNYHPRVDGTGTWVVFSGNADPAGQNADHSNEVWRMRTDGTALEQLTSDPVRYSEYPDISADGTKIVYSSSTDPLGTNADGNAELFLLDTQAGTTRQLTLTTDGSTVYSRISGNARWLYFFSDASIVEPNHHGRVGLYRMDLATSVTVRADGLSLGPGHYATFPNLLYYHPAITDSGRAIFAIPGNHTLANLDVDPELFAVDLDAPPRITVSPGPAPTTISWDVESGPVRYDVVRGDVSALRTLGESVDLGAVVCLEDDSADADTAGFADPDTPAPGRAFFYLYRGSPGVGQGAGSYGAGSSGLTRAPSAGDCGS
jgi:Tol biopolymer transport system component